MNLKNVEFESKFFNVLEIKESVYALISKDNKGSNAGIIDLGNDVIAFDAFLDIEAAEELIELCIGLTGKKPTFLINSHYHSDHTMGNCMFPETTSIISSKGAKENIMKFKHDLENDKEEIKQEVEKIKERLLETKDKDEISLLENNLKYYKNFIKPNAWVRIPDITFDSELLFEQQKIMKLKTYEIGHSPGDVILHLLEEKICFTGDLLFNKMHPWLGNGKPENTIKILEELLTYDIDYFIPGHGGVATKKDIEIQIQYIKEILKLVDSKKDIIDATFDVSELSEVFNDWYDMTFIGNINAIKNMMK